MPKGVKLKKAYNYKNNKLQLEHAGVPIEMPAQFIVNDREVLKIMVTPLKLREFGIGFLVSQGLINSLDDIKTELVGKAKAVLYYDLKKEIPFKDIMTSAYLSPGCSGGVSFKSLNLPKVKSKSNFKIRNILNLMKEMLKSASLYKKYGGFHSAALAADNELYMAEDVGRHNAVDKVIGAAFLKGVDFSKSVVLSTGRLTVEAVAKASRLGIPVLASRSSPTNLAVALAERQGVTLIGYTRGKSAKIYSHEERLKTG